MTALLEFFTNYPVVFAILLGACVLAAVGIFACIAAGMSDEWDEEYRPRPPLHVVREDEHIA